MMSNLELIPSRARFADVEMDPEAQLAVLEEKLGDTSYVRESLDVADRQHRQVTQLGDDLSGLCR